jgi:hypothetical protein
VRNCRVESLQFPANVNADPNILRLALHMKAGNDFSFKVRASPSTYFRNTQDRKEEVKPNVDDSGNKA